MARPTPESLRKAAEETERAEAARAAALVSEEKANADKAVAETADASADAALAAAGIATTGNGAVTSGTRRNWLHGSNGEFRSGAVAAIAVIALILVFLILGWIFNLANGKVNESRVEAVNSVAIAGGNQAAETKGKVSVMEGNLRHATEVATGAAVKAEAADANAHNANDNAKLALKKAVVVNQQTPQKQQSAPASNSGTVSSVPATPPAPQNLSSDKECKVFGKNKEVLADFLVASKNPKGIVVTTGAECLKERDAFVAAGNFRTLDRQVLTIK